MHNSPPTPARACSGGSSNPSTKPATPGATPSPASGKKPGSVSPQCQTLYIDGGADPQVRGRRPRRPAHTLQSADIVISAAGPGAPAGTRGSAPPKPPFAALRPAAVD